MDKYLVIREEAAWFFANAFPNNWSYPDLHTQFIDELTEKLAYYKTPENKAIFLDEIKNRAIKTIDSYGESIKKPDNYLYSCLNKALFFIEQEIELLPQIIHPSKNSTIKHKRNSVFSAIHI